MATMESQQFYRTIEKAVETQKFEPIYFLFGEEPYLLQQAISYLKASTLDGNTSDFNFNSYYAADVEISAVKDEVETLPMMASRRVVILREAQDLTDKEWLELESLILSPVETTVFIISANRVDKRKKYFKLLTEKAVAVEFKKPYENQIPGWIRHIGKGHQLQLTDEAIQLFHEWVGNQLIEIDSEMIKLKDFIVPRIKVEVEDVINCVSRRREESVFDLVECLALGDRVESLNRLVHLLDQGQNEIGIVSLVARHFRILIQIKQGLDQNLQGMKLAQHAQVPHFFIANYVQQSQKWSYRSLQEGLLVLADTDRALKSSPISSHIWLENLVLKTCQLNNT